ncbi:MAG TPA: hypothetical protein VFW83_08515 [Bryobacteraceae bacterium]|nr:hypothetical protein [Bryobacteraceae bacterium]
MDLTRRATLGIIAISSRLADAQDAPAAAQSAGSDRELESARENLRDDGQRIAAVPLPRTVEPAFHFRA